ncbi:MAG: hypothetical protein PHD37_15075 [Gallionellaceae bacterium]|nr:hypothetical protein [Gallionellaceae bacterium]
MFPRVVEFHSGPAFHREAEVDPVVGEIDQVVVDVARQALLLRLEDYATWDIGPKRWLPT